MTIVPSKAMNLLDKALADNEEQIQVAARGNDILVKSGKTTIYSRLVEGRFPRCAMSSPAATTRCGSR